VSGNSRVSADTPSRKSPRNTGSLPAVQDSLDPEAILREIEKIASSRTFRSAAGQRDFLRYVVTEELQGRGHLLKEYSIGVAVFRKNESFDPRLDSIVRAEAHKVRLRLSKYFDNEGLEDLIRIELPLGKYAPVFSLKPRSTIAAWRQHQPVPHFAPFGDACPHPALRIAVLPFLNRSSAKEDEFFSGGLTDELSHAFTRIPGLEVIARTSSSQFKGQSIGISDIGRRLNVQALIEGSVRRFGDRLRILVQLDDAVNGHVVWSQAYDRKIGNLIEIQQQISMAITSELGTHFCAGMALRLPGPRATSPTAADSRAHEEYLRGLHFWNRHTLEDFDTAMNFFQRAIAKDAGYARAYTGLAYCCVMLPIIKAVLPSEFIPSVRTAASKALELDASIGEAHIAMALPLIHEYKWEAAEEEFRKGLELCPSDVVGHAWYGTFLASTGRGEEALREHSKVLDLDPASPAAEYCYGQTLYYLHRHDEAARQFRKAIALDQSFPRAHTGLGLACIQKRSYLRAISELEVARKLTPGLGRVTADLAYAYAVAGNRDKAIEILNEFLARFTPSSFPALMIAEVYIGLGDADQAFEWLHRAIDQQDFAAFLKCDPIYDRLRSDHRFVALLKRMHLN
jgi:TolB-like protein/Flp pilus assembly protein TadD